MNQDSDSVKNQKQARVPGHESDVCVQGMTCASCEMLVERSWKDLPGVKSVKANSADGTVKIDSDRDISLEELQASLSDQKYKVSSSKSGQTNQLLDKRPAPFELAGLFALAVALTWVFTRLGALDGGVGMGATIGIGTALFLGLLASGSSCLAVVSGLLLSCAVPSSQDSNKKMAVKLLPTIMFVLGRTVVYVLLGGVLGWLGASLSPSPMVTSGILALASLYMVVAGLDMLHILPAWLKNRLPRLPKSWVHGALDKTVSKKQFVPLFLGGVTFFLPCGFTQALQVYALTTGSFLGGALVLGAFALGTAPGLFALGALAGSMKGGLGKFVIKTSGALIIVLGLFNLRNGIVLAGITFPPELGRADSVSISGSVGQANVNQVQVIKMKAGRGGYTPNRFTLQQGIPVRWEVDASQAAGCERALVSRKLGINTVLKQGVNVFEFTPSELGTIAFSCSMGMYTGQFTVVNRVAAASGPAVDEALEGEYLEDYFMCAPAACHDGEGDCPFCGGSPEQPR